jgi:hypothetical protein
MNRKRRRRLSIQEAVFWALQIPPVVILASETFLFKYLTGISIYAIVRQCLVGAQADSD